MLDTPIENVKLTFEQLQQIDVFQKTLANINNEISINSKLLIGQRADCEKATKETAYQKELLSDLETKVDSTKKQLEELSSEVTSSQNLLDENTEKNKSLGVENQSRSEELNQKEKELENKFLEHDTEEKEFNIKFNQLSEDQLSVKTAKDAFLKALETVTWK